MDKKEQEQKIEKEADKPVSVIETDSATRSLSEALRFSFVILKLIMIVFIIFFIGSGFRTIKLNEMGIVLRFGKIRGTGEERVLKSRGLPYWVFPYPVEQMIIFPIDEKVDLDIDSFWYYQTAEEKLSQQRQSAPPGKALDPLIDGYCLTRSDTVLPSAQPGTMESDYNIFHTRWRMIYQITDPVNFYKNIYIEEPLSSQIYFDVVKKQVAGMLKDILDSAVVSTMVNFTIDEALYTKYDKVSEDVAALIQQKLEQINSGIKIVSVQRTDNTWPMQVNDAFLAANIASQIKGQLISEATTYALKTINEAAGPVAFELIDALHSPDVNEQRLEILWQRVAGKAQQKIADARAYRKKIEESVRADAEYLKQILDEYRNRPALVISEIYRNAMLKILNSANEKYIQEPLENSKGSVIMIKYGTDPTLKPVQPK